MFVLLSRLVDYLFSRSYNLGKGTNKFDEIMNIVLPLIEKYSNFRLYVTGHSLGGALATIFAFKVAASNLAVQKPITCVSVASPKVGGNCFRKAFQVRFQVLFPFRMVQPVDNLNVFLLYAPCLFGTKLSRLRSKGSSAIFALLIVRIRCTYFVRQHLVGRFVERLAQVNS